MNARPARSAALAAAVLLACAPLVSAWGFKGHRLATRRALETLPPGMEMFRANARYLEEHAIDPDLWREGDKEESPNHFLDFEKFGATPVSWVADEQEHLRRHGGAAARRYGRLPWRVAEVYAQLVAAFRAGDSARALERAATLAHYVGDAHVPLHATENHNGQLTRQLGLHSRWETHLVERFEAQLMEAARPSPARHVADPGALMFEVLVASHAASQEVLASDRAAAGETDYAETPADERYDDAYYSRLWQREQARVVTRFTDTASVTGSLWASAWEDAGRPALDPRFRIAYVRGERRGILLSIDGAGAAAMDDAVKRGLMPYLAALRAHGTTPEGSLGSLPVKTAPAHAALFTGAWSDVNGVAGNEVPVPDGTVLQSMDGFDARRLLVEPIWVSAARQGLNVTVAQGTHGWPFAPYERGGRFGNARERLNLLDGYNTIKQGPTVYGLDDLELRAVAPGTALPDHDGTPRAFSLNVLGVRVEGLAYDDPADPVVGYDTLRLADAREGTVLKPRAVGDQQAFGALELRAGGEPTTAFFRLYELAPDLSRVVLFRSGLHVLKANRPELEQAAQAGAGGFVGGGAWDVYDRGAFGPTLWQGGDGTAERRYVETVALCLHQLARLVEFGARRTRWDLLVNYAPFPDEAMHTWLGRLEPSLPGYDPVLAARLRPQLDAVLELVDDYVGRIAALAGPGGFVAVVSDHGHVPVDRAVRPNVALRRAGLLALDGSGQVDLARSRAVYFPGNAGHVLINRVGRPGGIVTPGEEAEVRAAVQAALLGVRDPRTGSSPVRDVFDPQERCPHPIDPAIVHCPGAGRPLGGDLYLSLEPGYTVMPTLTGDPVEPAPVRGEHFTDPDRRVLQAALTFSGAGVASGRTLGLVRHVDVAPTVLALLGAEPAPTSIGTVLLEVLEAAPAPLHAERVREGSPAKR